MRFVIGVTLISIFLFFFNDTATTEIYTLSLHDALPILRPLDLAIADHVVGAAVGDFLAGDQHHETLGEAHHGTHDVLDEDDRDAAFVEPDQQDRNSTRLNSSHANISYAVFCLKKKNRTP